MNWKVTYRGKDGKPAESFFEAESRKELFEMLNANGINALRVEESKSGRKDRVAGRLKPHWRIILVFVGFSVAVGSFLAVKFSSKDRIVEIERAEDVRKPIKATPLVTKPNTNDVAVPPETAQTPEKPKREVWLGREIVSKTVVTNGTDLIITRIDAEGKVHKEYTTVHKRLFSNPVDITLSILLTTPEGALTPPLPPLGPRSGDVFAEALKKPIKITDDDTPEEKHIKELVMAAREEMLEELKNGKTVDEVIEDHCIYADENNRLRAEAMVQYKELIANGDEELAESFREKTNEMLSQKGAAPLKSMSELQEERMKRMEKRK